MNEVKSLIAEIKSKGLLRAGDKLELLYVVAAQLQDDYAAIKVERDALAAEVANTREQAEHVYAAGYNHGHLNTVDGIAYAPGTKDEFYHNALQVMMEAETPATDSYLNSVRAEGAEMLANKMQQTIDNAKLNSDEIGALAGAIFTGAAIANQLRAGEPS